MFSEGMDSNVKSPRHHRNERRRRGHNNEMRKEIVYRDQSEDLRELIKRKRQEEIEELSQKLSDDERAEEYERRCAESKRRSVEKRLGNKMVNIIKPPEMSQENCKNEEIVVVKEHSSPLLSTDEAPISIDTQISNEANNEEVMDDIPVTEDEVVVHEEESFPPYLPAIMGCRSVTEYSCLNKIEEGTYGIVFRAQDMKTNEIVALKRLKMEREKEGFPITSLREVSTLLKARHENVINVREIVVGTNMDSIFMVMDYVDQDLKSFMEDMKKNQKLSLMPGEVKGLLQQLLRGVAHLHDNWILHRDLKTSNILLSRSGVLKVGDFGLAREYGSPLKAYTSIVMTLWYRAPELLFGIEKYSTPIDMWSVGCIFGELVNLDAIFQGLSEVDQINKIIKTLGTPNETIWPGFSKLPLVNKIALKNNTSNNLRKKFSFKLDELGIDLLQKLLTYDPAKRITAEKALKHAYFKEDSFIIGGMAGAGFTLKF